MTTYHFWPFRPRSATECSSVMSKKVPSCRLQKSSKIHNRESQHRKTSMLLRKLPGVQCRCCLQHKSKVAADQCQCPPCTKNIQKRAKTKALFTWRAGTPHLHAPIAIFSKGLLVDRIWHTHPFHDWPDKRQPFTSIIQAVRIEVITSTRLSMPLTPQPKNPRWRAAVNWLWHLKCQK